MEENKKIGGKSIASLILGLVGLVAWLLPIAGYPITIVGLVLGCVARKTEKNGLNIAGIILCIITLVLSLGNSCLGVILQLSNI